MKKIVCFCAVAFAMVVPAGVYASNVRLLDDPPKRGTTTVNESCYTQGVSYERNNVAGSQQNVTVNTNGNSDVILNVNRSDGTSYSKDTRSGWSGTNNKHTNSVDKDDNIEIRCYPRNQK